MSEVVITGVGELTPGRLDLSSLALHHKVAGLAIEDAGIEWSAIDGLLTCGSFVDVFPRHALVTAEYLGIARQLKFCSTLSLGGASAATALVEAFMAITTGTCNTVLVLGADNLRSGMSKERAIEGYARFRHPLYEFPMGLLNPGAYALMAQRYMHVYGAKPEHLASAALSVFNAARQNPAAERHESAPKSIEEILSSKIIADPLHVLECSLISDGGGAIVVQRRDSSTRGVQLLGYGMGYEYDHIIQSQDFVTTGCIASSRRAFEMASLTPSDVDVAELYDCYSVAILLQLEALGFCGEGEAASFIEAGGIDAGSGVPIVTHGGLLGHGHTGASGGIYHLTEAVHQLRGDCGSRQVADCHVALVHAEGGIMSANTTLLLGS